MSEVELEAEVQRLRARTHEIAAQKDREMAELRSKVERQDADYARAREAVKEVRADWTTDPPSQEEYGFWRYTSQNTRTALSLQAQQLAVAEKALEEIARLNGRGVRAIAVAALAELRVNG